MLEYKRILAPVDGSDASDRAFKEAVAIALRNDAQLIVFNAVDDLVRYGNVDQAIEIYEYTREISNELVKNYVAEAEKAGAKVTSEVIKGDARHAIQNYAEENGVDLIVIGSTGKGNLERIVMGSVSSYVVRNAKCNVLVVR